MLAACDTLDGVEDGLIEDPLRCDFNIDSLACNGSYSVPSSGSNVTCLTAGQLKAVKAFYQGPVRSDNGSQLYPGFSFGSENGWLLQEGVLADAFSIPILQNLVYDNLSYNSNTFNWASNVADVDSKAGTLIDEISANLSSFRNNGGKLLVTQGWVSFAMGRHFCLTTNHPFPFRLTHSTPRYGQSSTSNRSKTTSTKMSVTSSTCSWFPEEDIAERHSTILTCLRRIMSSPS